VVLDSLVSDFLFVQCFTPRGSALLGVSSHISDHWWRTKLDISSEEAIGICTSKARVHEGIVLSFAGSWGKGKDHTRW